MKRITKNMFLNWHGGDDIWTQHDDLIEYFLSILNDKCNIDEYKNEIIEYNKEL